MAHGLNSVLKRGGNTSVGCKSEGKTGIGSRRIFAPHFKLQVLDSYRNDSDCKGNQRATARKYGIHRRQIQKWLQVENNLRNSVGKCKSVNNTNTNTNINININTNINTNTNSNSSHGAESPEARKCEVALASAAGQRLGIGMASASARQQGDCVGAGAYGEARVPCSPGSPPQAEGSPGPCRGPCSPWSPDDGSCCGAYAPPRVPLALDFSTHSRGRANASPSVASRVSPPLPADPAAPIDLSLKKVAVGALAAPVQPAPPLTPPRSPFSLAQPHPDVWDLSTKSARSALPQPPPSPASPKPVKLFKPYLDDVGDNNNRPSSAEDGVAFASCCTPYPLPCEAVYYNHNNNLCEIKSEYSYSLHELQPKSYYYAPQIVYHTPDFEMGEYCTTYEDISYPPSLAPLKQRHSYSLDFKLSAIDCYYQDSVCRGNQRAVASKYNIHRRQVQKWLKQAEELRQRNESVKQVNAVVS